MRISRKHPYDLPDEVARAMCRPRGTLTFTYTFDQLFDPTAGTGTLLEVVVEQLVFRLWRDDALMLHFVYASPGTGTRIASVPIGPLSAAKRLGVALVWSPEETRLDALDSADPSTMRSANGVPAKSQLRVGQNGEVYEVGSEGVMVMGARIFEAGAAVVRPTALDAWNETCEAVAVLLTGSSDAGYMFEVVQVSSVLVILSTGFEAYCETRFGELEAEGVRPDQTRLADKFLSARQREPEALVSFAQDAESEGLTFAGKIARERIDFGAYDDARRAYASAFGIRFGVELGVANLLLEEVQRTIGFRHRIAHVSPLVGFLNQPTSPPDEPVFANFAYATSAVAAFDQFVKALHAATIALNRND